MANGGTVNRRTHPPGRNNDDRAEPTLSLYMQLEGRKTKQMRADGKAVESFLWPNHHHINASSIPTSEPIVRLSFLSIWQIQSLRQFYLNNAR